MAGPSELSARQLMIKFETAPESGVFVAKCLINTDRGIQFQSDIARGTTPDCDLPEAPGYQWAEVDGLRATVSGAGTLNLADIPFFDTWYRSGDSKAIQVWAGTHGHWEFDAKLSAFDVTGGRNGKAQASVTIESDGVIAAYVVAA
jgi:hypothetical protein